MSTIGRVLVVDDDADVRDSLSLLLSRSGYQVLCYDSGRSLLDSETLPEHTCVLADVRMPEVDGFALQREIAIRWPRIPVVIMTGHGDVPMAVQAMRAGAIDFLEKPFEKAALLEAVRRGLIEACIGRRLVEPAPLPNQTLTGRELEVFNLLVDGHQNKMVAHRLGISVRTAEAHRAHIMRKLGARSLADLVRLSLSDSAQ
jgi:two-component system response regulator FixJ